MAYNFHKMKPEIKALWVKRLRELPNHRQGKRSLRINNKMCCLGVLCELAVAEGVVKRTRGTWFASHIKGAFSYGTGYTGTLPPEVVSWAGLKTNDPKIDYIIEDEGPINASTVNDFYKKNFDEIADLIEKNL